MNFNFFEALDKLKKEVGSDVHIEISEHGGTYFVRIKTHINGKLYGQGGAFTKYELREERDPLTLERFFEAVLLRLKKAKEEAG